MTIKKQCGGMYYATVHHKGHTITFIAPTWLGAMKSASLFVWHGAK